LFPPHLDQEAASDIREALRLGMPLRSQRFAEAACARLGIVRNSGKRRRTAADLSSRRSPPVEQQHFGFCN
jgi:hypothetical protein